MRRPALIPATIATLALALAACGGDADPTPTPSPTTEATPTAEATATATPEPTAGPLAPQEIFSRVSPAIAFVETPLGTGSGILIADDWLVSNAHVVWPFEEVRVVFGDGTEFIDARVEAWDLMADLAAIRLPDDHGIAPATFADPSGLPTGSELFLIGYPAETEEFPQPTISGGVLSRVRSWDTAGLTYIQTDAAITGGQSGGALVSDTGQVVGLSGFKFAGTFGLALAAPIVEERTNALIEDRAINAFSDRRLARNESDAPIAFTLNNFYDQRAFIVREPLGSFVDVDVNGINDAVLDIYDSAGGYILTADESASGEEFANFEIDYDVPFVIVASQLNIGTGQFEIASPSGLAVQTDPDDGRLLQRGQTLAANMDYPADIDMFELDLDAGETVTIRVESINFDPDLVIDSPGNTEDALAIDDDSGGGLFGTDSELTFTAPATDRYIVSVADVNFTNVGGYYLLID